MLLTQEVKQHTLAAIREDFAKKNAKRAYTQSRHATYLGINTSIYSRVAKGETEKVLSEGEWIRIAKKLNVPFGESPWKVARTKTFTTITAQLKFCMENAAGSMFCDDSNLGKTFACKTFAAAYANAAYVDCSLITTWSELIRAIAASLGFPPEGKLSELRKKTIENILALENPIIILDEAGDLNDAAWLKLKGLWNALEYSCGWYITGANGLRVKIENKLSWNKLGFEEMFSRLGKRFQALTHTYTEGEKAIFKNTQIELIIKAQAPELTTDEVAEMIGNCDYDSRRVRIELKKFYNRKKAA